MRAFFAAKALYSQIDGLFNAMTKIIERQFGHFDRKIERLSQSNFVSTIFFSNNFCFCDIV